MRLLLLSTISASWIYASQMLSVDEYQSLHTYNHRPSLMQVPQKRMAHLSKISPDEARVISLKHCKKDKLTYRLDAKKRFLFYIVKGEECELYINALDGSLLPSEELK